MTVNPGLFPSMSLFCTDHDMGFLFLLVLGHDEGLNGSVSQP